MKRRYIIDCLDDVAVEEFRSRLFLPLENLAHETSVVVQCAEQSSTLAHFKLVNVPTPGTSIPLKEQS